MRAIRNVLKIFGVGQRLTLVVGARRDQIDKVGRDSEETEIWKERRDSKSQDGTATWIDKRGGEGLV